MATVDDHGSTGLRGMAARANPAFAAGAVAVPTLALAVALATGNTRYLFYRENQASASGLDPEAVHRELVSADPDTERISAIGMLNAKLGGVQGLLQLGIIFVMMQLRFL